MTDILAAVRWWAALTLLGLVAWPLVYSVLRPLPDRGYAFVKMAGLLLVSYVFWLGGTLGFAANNAGGILLALLVVGGASLLAYRRRAPGDAPLADWLRAHRTEVIVTELLFAAVFALWVWVRAQNPSITATEKPMEFAFLNGVGRSAAFPPLDPWLSGYSISYYYFGYVMTSLLARLAFVPESVAFNLAIAWLVAGTAVGAYGVVFNLIASRRELGDQVGAGEQGRGGAGERRVLQRGMLLGLVAAAAVPIAGNLQIGLEVLHGNGVGSAGLWAWLDVRDINTPPADASGTPRYETSEWWWWRTSRVIHEYHLSGRAEEGLEPIVEIPAFSFVLGDMHPHVLALPFAFLSLGVALAWWLRLANEERRTTSDERRAPGLVEAIRQPLHQIGMPLWLLTAVVLGGLSFLNTWDVLIHLFVVMGVYFLAEWYRDLSGRRTPGRSIWSLLGRALLVGMSLGVVAGLLYLPFYLGFRSQAGPPFLLPMLMQPTRLAHYLIIFGMPLLVIVTFLVTLASQQRFRHWRLGLGVAAGVVVGLLLLMLLLLWIVASSASSAGTVINLAGELGRELPARPDALIAPGWGLSAMVAVLPAWFAARLVGPWLTLLLAGLLALVVMA
ncbi:DUF2298 domain-containing protein, partial [Promineifilum sp.]|uniref:DUF2298 domain-containing protein n=1 Tax=Promineifilum sp. TaxID=2664178 RepID=UPI0035B1EC34